MANSNEITVNGFPYYQGQTKLYDTIEIENSYEISSSVPSGAILDQQENEWRLYKQLLSSSMTSSAYEAITDDEVKQNYLDSYAETIKKFIKINLVI